MSTSHSPLFAVNDELLDGLAECHDTVELLADYALNTAHRAYELGLMYASLRLLQHRLGELSVQAGRHEISAAKAEQEVRHV